MNSKFLLELGNHRKQLENEIETLQESEAVKTYLNKRDELDQLNNDISVNLEQEISDVPPEDWKPNRFSKGKKDEYIDGQVQVLRSKRTVRTIIPKVFVEKYPFLVNMLVESGKIRIPIGIVEPELKKEEMEEIVEKNTTMKYELVIKAAPVVKVEPTEKKRETKEKKSKKMKVKA